MGPSGRITHVIGYIGYIGYIGRITKWSYYAGFVFG